MLHSVKQLYGNKLAASDGDIGHVKDFYFDDRNWAVRYLIVDTGSWLPGRQVLITPHAIGSFPQTKNVLTVNLTRKQIENSPPIESHKPVSRQYEEDYYRHYGWPNYWQGDGLWGSSSFPILEPPAKSPPVERVPAIGPQSAPSEGHLRSTQAVNGYHLKASGEIAGFVCDFMVNDTRWSIGELVIKTGHRFSGREVRIPAGKVNRISYDESTVYVDLTKADIEQNSAPDPAVMV